MDLVCACDGLSPLPVEEKAIMVTWRALAIPFLRLRWAFSPCLSRKRDLRDKITHFRRMTKRGTPTSVQIALTSHLLAADKKRITNENSQGALLTAEYTGNYD